MESCQSSMVEWFWSERTKLRKCYGMVLYKGMSVVLYLEKKDIENEHVESGGWTTMFEKCWVMCGR